jgi:hypothetical protein
MNVLAFLSSRSTTLRVLVTTILVSMTSFIGTLRINAQTCQCAPPVPICTWDDCLPPVGVMNGVRTVPIVINGDSCIATVFWCSRILSGTPCALSGYATSCEYKIQKVCFPPECAISCIDVEMNTVLLEIVRSIAAVNPANHFVPTSNQWSDPSYRTAWRLGFPACFSCSTDPTTNCVSLEACGSSTCYEWNEVYLCQPPNCPSFTPLCPDPCPASSPTMKPVSKSKTVGECLAPHNNCILCGY